jgi:hypothetical protein
MTKKILNVVGVIAILAAAARAQSPQIQQQLAAVAQSLAPGQRPVSQVYSTFGAHRSPVSFVVPLQGGICYSIVGTGGMGVADVDMFLFDPMNKRVALDRRYDPWTHIVYCPTFPGSYRVELKVKSGQGEVAFQVFQAGGAMVQPAPVAPPPAAPPPRHHAAAAVPPPVNDFIAQQLGAYASSVAPGQRPYGQVLAGFTSDGKGHDLFVQLEPGHCYTFVTVGAPTIKEINTYLWEPNTNRRLADNRSNTNLSHLTTCATMPGAYHYQAKSTGGYGEYRLGIYTQ